MVWNGLFTTFIINCPDEMDNSKPSSSKGWIVELEKNLKRQWLHSRKPQLRGRKILSFIASCKEVITWYATSKNAMCFFFSMRSAIFSHCSGVGSTPVGLWAHPCSKMIEPSGALYKKTTTQKIWEKTVIPRGFRNIQNLTKWTHQLNLLSKILKVAFNSHLQQRIKEQFIRITED